MASNRTLSSHHEHLQWDNHTSLVPNPILRAWCHSNQLSEGILCWPASPLVPTALCPAVTRVTTVYGLTLWANASCALLCLCSAMLVLCCATVPPAIPPTGCAAATMHKAQTHDMQQWLLLLLQLVAVV